MKRLAVSALLAVALALGSAQPTLAQKASPELQRLADAGQAAYDHHDYATALADWKKAMPILEKTDNAVGAGSVMFHIALCYFYLEDYPNARKAYREALEIHQLLKDRPSQANDVGGVCISELELANYPDALAACREAQSLHHDLGNRLEEAGDLGNIGVIERLTAHYPEALDAQQQALAIKRQIGDRSGEAGTLGNIGLVEQYMGRYEDALAHMRQAQALHHELGERIDEANDIGNAANVQADLGQFADALKSQQEVLGVARALKSRLTEANALENIGNLQQDQGRYDEALASHQQALALFRELHDPVGEAGELANTAGVLDDLGRYSEALESYRLALTIERTIKNRQGEADILGSIGTVEEDLGQDDAALAAHRDAMTIHRDIGDHRGEAANLGNIGNVLNQLRRYPEAQTAHEQSLALYKTLGDTRGVANELGNIAVVAENEKNWQSALDSANQALALQSTDRDAGVYWHTLRLVAHAEANLDRRDAAIAHYDAAVNQIETLRAGLTGSDRGSFLESSLYVYDEFIGYLADLDRQFPGQGYARKALEMLERKNGRAALEQIGRSAAQHFRGIDPQVVEAEGAADASVAKARDHLATLAASGNADGSATGAALQRLAAAKADADSLEARIKARFPAYYELRHPQPIDVPTLQQKVLRPGEVLVAYDLLEPHSLLWLVDRERVQLFQLSAGSAIEDAVARVDTHVVGLVDLVKPGAHAAEKLERAAAADVQGYAADAFALYRLLVPEAAAGAIAQAKSLIVVPSRSLYRLAFEALVTRDPAAADANAQPHYLLEDTPVSYIPSASLLGVVRTSYAQPPPGRATMLAFANPAFGATSGFPSLPGTQTEADAVRAGLSAPAASLIDGEAATRANLLDLDEHDRLRNVRYLLFATHAVLPSEIKGLTQPAIVLAHPERGNGLLTMADIFGLSLDADFVSLSACNTGVPTESTQGEGISGFTRAFLYAGTPAISVTLWQVDDAAAPRMTPAFFTGMQRDGLSPAAALRRAKLNMLASPEARFRHPYAWAPSVIFGDGGAASSNPQSRASMP